MSKFSTTPEPEAAALEQPARQESRRSWPLALIAAGLSSVAAVVSGFLIFSPETCAQLVTRLGYPVMALTFALLVCSLVQLRRAGHEAGDAAMRPQRRWLPPLVIGSVSLFAITAEPFEFKVLYDEFVLQSTAMNLHLEREVATPYRAYSINGVFLPLDSYVDKRPFFFPFLVSLVHDLTGFRPANAFVLNAVLTPVLLTLVFHLCGALAGRWAGLLGVLLIGSLPLLAQNATGSGMELLNVTLLLAVISLAAAYVRRWEPARLSALCLATVLLAQTRYESALYVVGTGFVVLWTWRYRRRVELTWPAVLTPLLLVPYAWQNRVLNSNPGLWEIPAELDSRFGWTHLGGNLVHAARFFFNTEPFLANSLLLTLAGLLGLPWLARRLWRGRQPALFPVEFALGPFALLAAANLGLLMFYYWGELDQPIVSRLSLPFHLVLVFGAVVLAAVLEEKWKIRRWILGAAVLFFPAYAVRATAHHYYTAQNLVMKEIRWELQVMESLPGRDPLVLTNKSTLPWIIHQVPSIAIHRARSRLEPLRFHWREESFGGIFVTQSLKPADESGNFRLTPESELPAGFELETVAEKAFGARLARISRVRGLPDEGPAGGKDTGGTPK